MTKISTSNETRVCDTCHRSDTAHPFRHPFIHNGIVDESVRSRDDKSIDDAATPINGAQGRVRIAPAGDPVLRLLLIRKGLITVEDLNQIEAELQATGVVKYEPPQSLG